MIIPNNQAWQNDQIEDLLKCFIAFKSTENEPTQKMECLDWVVRQFLKDNIKDLKRGEFEGAPWLYLKHPESKLLVFAHADVVPARDDLFELKVDGDTVKGRGVSDMKGNMLSFLVAYVHAVQEKNRPPVSILITTDEEVAGNTIPHLLDSGIVQESVAFTPDTNDKGIVCEHKGVCWAQLTANGKGGHGAYPWNTQNPIWLLCEALKNIREAFPPGTYTNWKITASPTTLKGSDARNQVAQSVTCGIDIRFPSEACASANEALEKVASVLPKGCSLTEVLSASPLHTDPKHPIVVLYKEIAEQVLDMSIPFTKEHGGTDARYFSERGIPAFLYGPKGGGIHSDEEWVSISSLQEHYEIYRELFSRL